jgi:hypothetical protein
VTGVASIDPVNSVIINPAQLGVSFNYAGDDTI